MIRRPAQVVVEADAVNSAMVLANRAIPEQAILTVSRTDARHARDPVAAALVAEPVKSNCFCFDTDMINI